MSNTNAKRSWGHHMVGVITSPDDQKFIKETLQMKYDHGPIKCSASKCNNQSTHICEWNYITGRKGRISSARRHYCFDHAKAFAVRNNIDFDNVPKVLWSDCYTGIEKWAFAESVKSA